MVGSDKIIGKNICDKSIGEVIFDKSTGEVKHLCFTVFIFYSLNIRANNYHFCRLNAISNSVIKDASAKEKDGKLSQIWR